MFDLYSKNILNACVGRIDKNDMNKDIIIKLTRLSYSIDKSISFVFHDYTIYDKNNEDNLLLYLLSKIIVILFLKLLMN